MLEGEEEAVITALDMEDAWKKEVRIYSSCVDVCAVHVFCNVYYVVCEPSPPPPRTGVTWPLKPYC